MILCFDENMPPGVAKGLQALGECEAVHITDHLPRGTPDEEVFRYIAEKSGWYLVTQDQRIQRNPLQRRALAAAGIGAFILTGRAQRDRREMMVFILERLPEMGEQVAATPVPFIFGIPDRGPMRSLG